MDVRSTSVIERHAGIVRCFLGGQRYRAVGTPAFLLIVRRRPCRHQTTKLIGRFARTSRARRSRMIYSIEGQFLSTFMNLLIGNGSSIDDNARK